MISLKILILIQKNMELKHNYKENLYFNLTKQNKIKKINL